MFTNLFFRLHCRSQNNAEGLRRSGDRYQSASDGYGDDRNDDDMARCNQAFDVCYRRSDRGFCVKKFQHHGPVDDGRVAALHVKRAAGAEAGAATESRRATNLSRGMQQSHHSSHVGARFCQIDAHQQIFYLGRLWSTQCGFCHVSPVSRRLCIDAHENFTPNQGAEQRHQGSAFMTYLPPAPGANRTVMTSGHSEGCTCRSASLVGVE